MCGNKTMLVLAGGLLLCGPLVPQPAIAEEVARTPFEGVWRGTVGNLPIHACFNGNSGGIDGVYYYDRHLKPIALRQDDDASPDALIEKTGYDNLTGGQWLLGTASGNRASATWRSGNRKLPVALFRIAYTEQDYSGPCESVEFFAARMAGSKVVETPQTLGSDVYTRMTYQPGEHFIANTDSIWTFALVEQQPGDAEINQAMLKILPGNDPESSFAECMRMNLSSWGWDGGFEQWADPEMITDNWVGVHVANSAYCGGAHPSYWQNRQVFDRRTGREVDPSAWFSEGALKLYDPGDDETYEAQPKQWITGIDPALFKLFAANWLDDDGGDGDSECLPALEDGLGFDLGIAPGGVVFKPDVPHVMTPCAVPVTIPWDQLSPFLSPAGQKVREELDK